MKTDFIVLAGGCFWCTEEIFLEVPGVLYVQSGYSGGHFPNPRYEDVSTGNTGHAECVKVTFDLDEISLNKILLIFFKTHNPTTPNMQGADIGSQYRSAIFYNSLEQKEIAEKMVIFLSAKKIFDEKIVTQILPLRDFYPAEENHQKYYRKNQDAYYCKIVINPKLKKLKELLSSKEVNPL